MLLKTVVCLFSFGYFNIVWPETNIESFDEQSEIHFKSTEYLFETVQQGESVVHTFEFKNIGTRLLKIYKINVSCGCTLLENWDREILPGESGKVTVTIITDNLSGFIDKSIDLFTNDPRNPNVILHLRGNIWMPLRFKPALGVFPAALGHESLDPIEISIFSEYAKPIKILKYEFSSNQFYGDIDEIDAGKKFIARINGRNLTQGKNSGFLNLFTDIPNSKPFKIPLIAHVLPNIQAIPGNIRIYKNEENKTTEKTIYLHVLNRSNKKVVIDRLISNHNDIKLENIISQRMLDQHYRIKVTVPHGIDVNELLGAKAEINFKDKTNETIFLPYIINKK